MSQRIKHQKVKEGGSQYISYLSSTLEWRLHQQPGIVTFHCQGSNYFVSLLLMLLSFFFLLLFHCFLHETSQDMGAANRLMTGFSRVRLRFGTRVEEVKKWIISNSAVVVREGLGSGWAKRKCRWKEETGLKNGLSKDETRVGCVSLC